MESHFRKIHAFGRLHFFLTALFLFLVFASHCIPDEKIMGHRELSLQLLSEFPRNGCLPGDTPSLKPETEFLTSLNQNPEYSTLWNTLTGQDQGFRWNGMQAPGRFLLCFFHIGQIRYLCMIAFFMLLFGAAWKISRTYSSDLMFHYSILFHSVPVRKKRIIPGRKPAPASFFLLRNRSSHCFPGYGNCSGYCPEPSSYHCLSFFP